MGSLTLLSETSLALEQQEIVSVAQVCGDQLLVVINDILEHTKLEENKIILEDAPFSLHDIIFESIQVVGYSAEKKNLELICDVLPGTICMWHATI